MRVLAIAVLLLGVVLVAPAAEAEPAPPECYDRGPVVDGLVVEVWLTRGCDPYVVVNKPTCTVDVCP